MPHLEPGSKGETDPPTVNEAGSSDDSKQLLDRRRKRLDAHLAGALALDLFKEEQDRITRAARRVPICGT